MKEKRLGVQNKIAFIFPYLLLYTWALGILFRSSDIYSTIFVVMAVFTTTYRLIEAIEREFSNRNVVANDIEIAAKRCIKILELVMSIPMFIWMIEGPVCNSLLAMAYCLISQAILTKPFYIKKV